MSQTDTTEFRGGSVVLNILAGIAVVVMVGLIAYQATLAPEQMQVWQASLAAFVSLIVCFFAAVRATPPEGERRGDKDNRGVLQVLVLLLSFVVLIVTLIWWGYVAWPWL